MSSPICTPESARYYVLDTSVLVHNPAVLEAFAEHVRVIPEVVLEELDRLKDGRNPDVAASARQVARQLEEWTQQYGTSGLIPLPKEGYVRIELNHRDAQLPKGWAVDKNDNRILQVCKGLADTVGSDRVVLVSKDAILRVKARALDLEAQDLRMDQIPAANKDFWGWSQWSLRGPQLERWLQIKGDNAWPLKIRDMDRHAWFPNQYLDIVGPGRVSVGQAQVQWDTGGPRLVRLSDKPRVAYGITPRNPRQRWALDALLSDRIQIVTLCGAAGTGKTLLALAAGLQLTAEDGRFDQLLVCRPAISMGEDLGYLPGTEGEKIAPYMRPILDNLRTIHRTDPPQHGNKGHATDDLDRVVESVITRYIDMQAVGFLRGRTISHQYLVIDEAQNLTPHQVRTILTRVGEGAKVVLCGDPTQIDAPFLDARSNGLVYAVEHLKTYAGAAHIGFPPMDSVRSPAAQWVAEHF